MFHFVLLISSCDCLLDSKGKTAFPYPQAVKLKPHLQHLLLLHLKASAVTSDWGTTSPPLEQRLQTKRRPICVPQTNDFSCITVHFLPLLQSMLLPLKSLVPHLGPFVPHVTPGDEQIDLKHEVRLLIHRQKSCLRLRFFFKRVSHSHPSLNAHHL